MAMNMMLGSSRWILSSRSRTHQVPHASKSSTLSLTHTTKIAVKESTIVRPKEETPSGSVWLSNLDLVMPDNYHSRVVFFYRSNGAANFFDAAVLKAALSEALVDFYPLAGRLRKDNNGRLEVNCSGEGVLFVEAECDATVEELGFTPRADVSLLPKVEYAQGLTKFPLSLIQLTRFKCGGVSLGLATEHHVADGIATLHYINTWSDIARGGQTTSKPPFFDRQLLSARNPPQPEYHHIEYQPPPTLKTPLDIADTSFRTFGLTADQINALKQKCNSGGNGSFSMYEVIAGHVWRSVCMARQLPHDQETKLQLPVNGRPRMRPRLPRRIFGNALFYTTALTTCGEMESNPLSFAVGKVHEAVVRMDGDYMRSALDYVELHRPESEGIVRSSNNVKCPNFGITNWVRLPLYEADFGWGKPIYAGTGGVLFEGKSFLISDPQNEGGVLFAITLLKPHMELFEDLLYHI